MPIRVAGDAMIESDARNLQRIWAAAVLLSNFVRDGIRFLGGCVSSRTSLAAENLFLRKRLSFYQDHQIRPRWLTNSARVALVFWSRFFEWRSAVLIVKPILRGLQAQAWSVQHDIDRISNLHRDVVGCCRRIGVAIRRMWVDCHNIRDLIFCAPPDS